MNNIRLIALDIDGTILTEEKLLTDRTRAAIEAATEAGITVALVTGRPLGGIPDDLMSLRGLGYIISSNGAATKDLLNNSFLRNVNLESETASEIIEFLRDYDLIYAVFTGGVGYSEKKLLERHIAMTDNPAIETYLRKSRRITYDMDDLIWNAEDSIENIWLLARDQKERDALNRYIREKWNVQTVLTGKKEVEIGAPLADKGIALSALAEFLSIQKNEILAIGDSGNDLGLLQSAGIAVAMGNADDDVKRLADMITASNDEDGAAMVIEKYIIV